MIKNLFALTILFFIHSKSMQSQNTSDIEIEARVTASIKEIDWAGLLRYHQQNIDLSSKDSISNDVIFMGDSITEGWSLYFPEFFSDNNYLNRGISGQTTPQMLIRFRQDVIELKPKVVVILAGINDIAQNTKYYGIKEVAGNISSMVELAISNNITPIICSVLPADKFLWSPSIYPAELVKQLNIELSNYAEEKNILFLDYYKSMNNGYGGMKPELTNDGVHVTKEGYSLMANLVNKSIKKTLNK
tara:strand:- start:1005 stop:1742 length:738 start_codon:yes stop_codon:yes gene_type:complete